MNHKENFMTFVFLGAIARDLSQGTHDSQRIAAQADRIAANSLNAAKVFLAYLEGRAHPHQGMLH